MKTQINSLRSGTANQILNPSVDYSTLPPATSHNGHSGTASKDVIPVWEQVKKEHPKSMTIKVMDETLQLTANWSTSGKSVIYSAPLSAEQLAMFGIKNSATKTASFAIHSANIIIVSNGKNSYVHICPSLVEIL